MNLILRIASALVLLPIALWCIHRGGLAMMVLIAVAIVLALSEAFRMIIDDALERRLLSLLAVAQLAGLGAGIMDAKSVGLAFGVLSVVIGLQGVVLILRPGEIDTIPRRWATAVFLPLYVGLPLLLALALRQDSGPALIYLCLASTFCNDTFAYFAGKSLGRHPLHPRVSPKKTWEGFIGGVIGSLVASLLIWKLMDLDVSLGAIITYALLMGVFTPMGDLAESLLKRASGLKDSGNLIPGHGGVLDRIDALLFGFPLTYLFALLVR